MPFRIPSSRINWTNSSFLIGTFLITCTAGPLYLWHYGVDAFQVSLFFFFVIATGLGVALIVASLVTDRRTKPNEHKDPL